MDKFIFKIFLRKAIILCFLGASISASAIASTSSVSTEIERQDVSGKDYKAGAGFLLIATFLILGDYGVGFNEFPTNRNNTRALEDELATLKDRMSILAKASFQQGKSFTPPSEEDMSIELSPMCEFVSDDQFDNSTNGHKEKVMDSIKRTLRFIESHIDQLHTIEPAFALAKLKVVDDKHGSELQKRYPISEWISHICGSFSDSREADSCNALTSIWKSRQGQWKPKSIIQEYGAEFKSIGSDSEVIWGRLNGECQAALLTRCEVPYVCERTLFDPTPRSQYMLTHQLLQRILADLGTCKAAKGLLDQEVNHRMCAKMYKEAKLISALKTPEILRDLFVEQVALCGYLGYPNFFREDWLERIISWESSSVYGCFVKDKKSRNKFMTTDKAIKRLPTDAEKMKGVKETAEECLPHFTSVSLMALTAYWDYLEENNCL